MKTTFELRTEKDQLLKRFNNLSETKKMLYSNVDIESPMSIEEKQLNRELALIASEMNSIVMKIRQSK